MGNSAVKESKRSPTYTVIQPLGAAQEAHTEADIVPTNAIPTQSVRNQTPGSGKKKNKTHPEDDVLPEYDDPIPPETSAPTYKPASVGATFNVSMLTTSIGLDDDDAIASDSLNGPNFDFEDVDEHAREACASDARTFGQLVEFLQEPIKGDEDRELWTVRAILVWLSERVSEGIGYPWPDRNHPFGFLCLIREDKATYADLFTTICRHAKLKCVTIYGQVKGVQYRPGDQTLPEASWNAVQINGNWHLVQPYWICRSVAGYQHGGVTIIEKDQHMAHTIIRGSDGQFVKQFNDYYFLVRPEAFIYEACPYDSRWQLLPPSSTRTMDEFRRQACLFRSFAQLGLKLISIDSCILKSDGGVCTIVIKANRSIANSLYTRYTIFAVKLDVNENEFFNCNRQKLVFNERSDNDRFRFEIRFPVEGIFIIAIEFGFKHGKEVVYSKCCSFRLQCDKRQENCKPLPYDVGDVGWGPGPQAMDAGLCRPSEKSGRVFIPPKDVVKPNKRSKGDKDDRKEIRFDLNSKVADKISYEATLQGQQSGSDFEGDVQNIGPVDMSENVTAKVDTSKKQLTIKVTLPDAGEYALSILAAENVAAKRSFKPVCHYLLTTEASQEQQAQQKVAIEKLLKVLGSGDIKMLTEGVRLCEETGVEESNQVLSDARKELTPLVKKKAALTNLQHYLDGENMQKIREAIQKCFDVGIEGDHHLVSAAMKKLEFLRQKNDAAKILRAAMEHWYTSDLEDAVTEFTKFCEGTRNVELMQAEALLERRKAFDAKLKYIAQPMKETVESLKKALLVDGSKRDALVSKLQDKVNSHADPDFATGIRILIADSERRLGRP